MKSSSKIIAIILALLVAVAINFQEISVVAFIISSVVLSFVVFGIFTSLYRMVCSIKQKNILKTVLYLLAVMVLLGATFLRFQMVYLSPCVFNATTYEGFKTNILTGQCTYVGNVSVCYSSPWYHKPNCDISDEEKELIRKNSKNSENDIGDIIIQ